MATLIDIHEAGELVFTLGAGRLRAFEVQGDGTIKEISTSEAVAREREK